MTKLARAVVRGRGEGGCEREVWRIRGGAGEERTPNMVPSVLDHTRVLVLVHGGASWGK